MAITSPVTEDKIFIQNLNDFGKMPHSVSVSMLRLDVMHPIISGNKWFKLKYNITAAANEGNHTLLTYGGAFSNHLIATAAAASYAGLNSVGIVRGMQDEQTLNSVLMQCKAYGMKLHFVTREQYGQKYLPNFVDEIRRQYPNAYHIPEGGANVEGQLGAGEISHYIDSSYTHILLSVGSGTTFLGLRNALPYHQALLGFAPMKGGIYLEPIIRSSLKPTKQHNWSITDRFHYGGFGKTKEELILFMQEFRQQYGFDLDRVYTGKMMLGLSHLIQESYFAQGSKLLCIHTGGLTGN